jgi:hypothetical protein
MNPEDQIRALQAELAALRSENAQLKGGDPYSQYMRENKKSKGCDYGGQSQYMRKEGTGKSYQNMPYRMPSPADEFMGTAPPAGPNIQSGPYRPGMYGPGPYIKKL